MRTAFLVVLNSSLKPIALISTRVYFLQKQNVLYNLGLFHLYLSKFAFINQFYSRMTSKWLVQESFHNQYKIFWYGVLLKMRGIFWSYLFWGTANWHLNWQHSIIWTAILVQQHWELEMNLLMVGFICTFSLLISLSFTFQSSKFNYSSSSQWQLKWLSQFRCQFAVPQKR